MTRAEEVVHTWLRDDLALVGAGVPVQEIRTILTALERAERDGIRVGDMILNRRDLAKLIDGKEAAEAALAALKAEVVEVVGWIADRASDGRRTASLPVIAREARDLLAKLKGEG